MIWVFPFSSLEPDDGSTNAADGQHSHEQLEEIVEAEVEFTARMTDMERRLRRLELVVDVLSRTAGSLDAGWSDPQ